MNTLIPDLYEPAHKTMGLLVADLLRTIAAGHPAEAGQWDRVRAAWEPIEASSAAHDRAEELHLRPMVAIAAPALAAEIEARHEGIERARRAVSEAFCRVVVADCADLAIAARLDALARINAFLTGYLQHIAVERDQATQAILSTFAPPALFAAARAVAATLPAEARTLAFPVIARPIEGATDPFVRLVQTSPSAECLTVEATRVFEHARRELESSISVQAAA